MNQTLSNLVLEAPTTGEFQFRYRAYTPTTPAKALVVYLPQYGGTLDGWENSILPQRLASSGIASLVGLPVPEGTGYMDDSALQALHAMLVDALQRLQCPSDKLVLVGFQRVELALYVMHRLQYRAACPGPSIHARFLP